MTPSDGEIYFDSQSPLHSLRSPGSHGSTPNDHIQFMHQPVGWPPRWPPVDPYDPGGRSWIFIICWHPAVGLKDMEFDEGMFCQLDGGEGWKDGEIDNNTPSRVCGYIARRPEARSISIYSHDCLVESLADARETSELDTSWETIFI